MWLIDWYWEGVLGWPLQALASWFYADVETAWKVTAWKVSFTFVLLLLLYESYLRIWRLHRTWKTRREFIEVPPPDIGKNDPTFTATLDAAKAPEQVIAELKKNKEWLRLGEVLTNLNRPKDAAKYFQKGGDLRRSAAAWATAGYTAHAAKLLVKSGDHATAGRFYAEIGKHREAGQAFENAGDLTRALAEYTQAGCEKEAAKISWKLQRPPQGGQHRS